jgi:hypothetical protein
MVLKYVRVENGTVYDVEHRIRRIILAGREVNMKSTHVFGGKTGGTLNSAHIFVGPTMAATRRRSSPSPPPPLSINYISTTILSPPPNHIYYHHYHELP